MSDSENSYSQQIRKHVETAMKREEELRRQEQRPEFGATALKAVAGMAPIFGGSLVECLNFLIPNRRFDRFVRFTYELEARLLLLEEQIPRDEIRSRMQQPEFERLLEEGAQQASRALSDERRGRIAAILKNGLVDDDPKKFKYERTLQIFEELSDAEILILMGYFVQHQDYLKARDYWENYEDLLAFQPYLGASNDEVEAYAIRQSYINHLLMLNLLEQEEAAGSFKPSMGITYFGMMIIFTADLHEELRERGHWEPGSR